ncbi:SPOR domain-containing protein [Novosphingobium sp.]|uniref:SPOR domain-containing protein n=1 Tax=Novosphingobium sp. TaxID=1874826 RepID=UPI0025E80BF7|nr:SPOR domain-containing protein [Novosphingobium sp.]
MRSVIDLTALGTLALIAVTVTPIPANARAPRTESVATTGVGPESDYPLVVGEAFTVDGKTYVPSDTMNYDAVGYAEAGEGGDIVTGAHRTLPLPSYVEVTSLTSGKTILVRLTRRGPMAGANLVALSPGAWSQLGLGADAKAPVRVRRVNPPEPERAMLRLGQHAPDRMETPPGLLGVLKRKLGDGSVAVLSETARGAAASPMAGQPSVIKPDAAKPGLAEVLPIKPVSAPKPATQKLQTPKPQAKIAKPAIAQKAAPAAITAAPPKVPAPVVAKVMRPWVPSATNPAPANPSSAGLLKSSQAVQVGAFSSEDRAKAAATKIGAQVSQSGKVWRVRLGPFPDQASADRGLAKARAAGYRDARIVREP